MIRRSSIDLMRLMGRNNTILQYQKESETIEKDSIAFDVMLSKTLRVYTIALRSGKLLHFSSRGTFKEEYLDFDK